MVETEKRNKMIIFTDKQFEKYNQEMKEYFRYTDRDFIYFQNRYIKELELKIDNALKYIDKYFKYSEEDSYFDDYKVKEVYNILKGKVK